MRALLVLALLWPGLCLATAAPAPAPTNPYPDVARAYWVERDGRPLWAGAADARLPIASLAKLMTALLVSERGALDGEVTVGAGAAGETGARLGIRQGERFRRGDLLIAMLVRSANDACRALADDLAGDQPRFVQRMNARARQLHLDNTAFANACGHDDPRQYSSARDLARLARAVMARPELARAVALPDYAFQSLAGRRFRVRATNALLAGLPGTRGIKTGFTPGAGRCLVALVERDGVEVLAVLLHAPDRWWDSAGLVELAFREPARPGPAATR